MTDLQGFDELEWSDGHETFGICEDKHYVSGCLGFEFFKRLLLENVAFIRRGQPKVKATGSPQLTVRP